MAVDETDFWHNRFYPDHPINRSRRTVGAPIITAV